MYIYIGYMYMYIQYTCHMNIQHIQCFFCVVCVRICVHVYCTYTHYTDTGAQGGVAAETVKKAQEMAKTVLDFFVLNNVSRFTLYTVALPPMC